MSSNWRVGERIEGRWEVYQTLKGGMSDVHVVYDHAEGAFVVAKTLQDAMFELNPQVASRFRREALAWIDLDRHDNLAQALFTLEIGLKPYLFLEYVAGGDLRRWIGTPRLTSDVAQVLRFAIQFCDGMIHAASNGVAVHRDIKPENCLITEEPVLKITDFGLAKALHDSTTDMEDGGGSESTAPLRQEPVASRNAVPARAGVVTAATAARTGLLRRIWNRDCGGTITTLNLSRIVPLVTPGPPAPASVSATPDVIGTPFYMAPEQFGQARHVDVHADVYAFGVMLYEMVGGRRPFTGRTLRELEQQHRKEVPPRLGCFEPLEILVRSCLSKDAPERPADFHAIRLILAHIYEELTGQLAPHPRSGNELNISDLINKSSALITLDRPAEALGCSEQALALDESHIVGWIAKGNALAQMKRYDEALACFERALEQNPDSPQACVGKGSVLLSLERSEEALACLDRAVQLHPGCREWFMKASGLHHCRRLHDALFCYERAMQLDPHDAKVWRGKGAVLSDLGRWQEALRCSERALELNPSDYETWFNKGHQQARLYLYQQALDAYEHALELQPQFQQAWANQADVLRSLRRFEDALNSCSRALELDPNDDKAWIIKGEILIGTGNGSEALACLEHAAELNPKANEGWLRAGFLLLKCGTPHEALRCFDRALSRNERSEQGWFGKAKALAMLEQWAESLSSFDRALELNPVNTRTAREKHIVSGYLEQSSSGIAGEALRQAIEFRKLARVALAGGRIVSLDLAKAIQSIIQQNALHIPGFQDKRAEFAKINSWYLLLHSVGMTFFMMGASAWSPDKTDVVVRSAAAELVWMAGTIADAGPGKDEEVAAALRGQYDNIREFLPRWSEVKKEKGDEAAGLLLVAVWYQHVVNACPACAALLAGKQAEAIVATKLVQAFSQRSLALASQAWRNVEVI
jgi:tetratricopeptide (TPR) repeat protein